MGVVSGAWAVKRQKTTVKSQWMWRVMMNLLPLMMILNRKALRRSWVTSVLKARSGRVHPWLHAQSERHLSILSVQPVNPRILCVFMLPARTAGRSSTLNLAIKRRRLASNGRRIIPPACFISANIMPASSASRSWTSLMPVISAKRPGSGPRDGHFLVFVIR